MDSCFAAKREELHSILKQLSGLTQLLCSRQPFLYPITEELPVIRPKSHCQSPF